MQALEARPNYLWHHMSPTLGCPAIHKIQIYFSVITIKSLTDRLRPTNVLAEQLGAEDLANLLQIICL